MLVYYYKQTVQYLLSGSQLFSCERCVHQTAKLRLFCGGAVGHMETSCTTVTNSEPAGGQPLGA